MTNKRKDTVAMTKTRHVLMTIGVVFLMGAIHSGALANERSESTEPESDAWLAWTSVEDVIEHRPAQIETLLKSLDLERDGLEAVREAHAAGDLVAAGEALLAYYRQSDSGHWLRERERDPELSEESRQEVDEILRDIYTASGSTGKVPRTSDGHLDWTHRGPDNDRQFVAAFNRHGHLSDLLKAYEATGEEKYLRRLDEDLRSWLILADGKPDPKGQGRGFLEAALRLPHWTRLFYRLQDEPEFRPATRLLMLAALPPHGDYLRRTIKRNHNWATMQMNGLGTIGLAFPEFEKAEAWWNFARREMARELKKQIYPDGAQTELTAGYHMVALKRFGALMETAVEAGEPMDDDYAGQVEKMYGYIASVIRPDGNRPNNSNSDMGKVDGKLREAAELFDRPDWRYIATHGEAGERPQDPPSRFLPWAGQMVSRSGWDADAHWSFFDVGPFGTNRRHAHRDKLHLSIDAHGRPLPHRRGPRLGRGRDR